LKPKIALASLEDDIVVKNLQKAIRLEMRNIYNKKDKAIIYLVLVQLIHENRLEITPNGRK
jgi:hypothetical protein